MSETHAILVLGTTLAMFIIHETVQLHNKFAT